MTGIDIVYLPRIHVENEAFLRHVLTKEERKEYDSLSSEKRKKEYVGGHFAAKEALFKAVQNPNYLSCSILHDETGKPYIKEYQDLEVSISHDGDYAVAIVTSR